MSGQYSVESVEERVDQVMEMAREERRFFETQFTGTPPGYTDPDNETFAAWYEGKLMESPPVPMALPDGRVIVQSPWAMALAFADGGMDLINRYNRIRGGSNAD